MENAVFQNWCIFALILINAPIFWRNFIQTVFFEPTHSVSMDLHSFLLYKYSSFDIFIPVQGFYFLPSASNRALIISTLPLFSFSYYHNRCRSIFFYISIGAFSLNNSILRQLIGAFFKMLRKCTKPRIYISIHNDSFHHIYKKAACPKLYLRTCSFLHPFNVFLMR